MWAKFIAFLWSLPELLNLYQQAKKAIEEMREARKNKEQDKKRDQAGQDLKDAQESGDEQKQKDALSSVLDDYNS